MPAHITGRLFTGDVKYKPSLGTQQQAGCPGKIPLMVSDILYIEKGQVTG